MKSHISSILLITLAISEYALASCGAASCPLNSYHHLEEGYLRISYSHEYINQDQIFVGSTKAFVGAIPQHHDEVQTMNSRSVIQVTYGVLEWFSLGVDVPFVHREHSHIHNEQSGDEWESWNFSGMGDVVIRGEFSILPSSTESAPRLSLTGGIKLPTGVTDARNAEGEAAEVAIQPGSGSTDGIVGLNYRQTLFSVPTLTGEYAFVPIEASIGYKFGGSGTLGWQFGNTVLVSIGSSYEFTKRASLLLQFNGQFQDYADVGTTGEPRENTGGTWFFLSPGLGIQLNDAFLVYSYLQIPLYQDVHGIQQTARFNLKLGVEANVNLAD